MPPLSMALAAAASSLVSLAAHATIGGTITDAATGAAPPAGTFVYASLMLCSHDGNALCDQSVDFQQSKDGTYKFNDALAPGRYQVTVTADGYLGAYPATFEVVGDENHRVDVPLDAMPVAYSNPAGCGAPDARGFCQVAFDLRNTSAAAVDLDAWFVVATTSAVPAGWSRFAAGDKSADATRIKLAAGASRTVTQSVYVGADMAKGSYATMELHVSRHGKPDQTLVFDMFPTVYFGVTAGVGLTPARAAALGREHAQRASALHAGAPPAADKRTTITFNVTDAATGQPLPLSARPTSMLMSCNEPDDTYCRWIEGDAVPLTASGVAVVDTTGMFPGRYSFTTYASDNYAYTYSATFEVPLAGSQTVAQPMGRTPIAIDAVTRCDQSPLDECVLSYTLRNTTDVPQHAALWIYDYMLSGEFSNGNAIFSQGRKGKPNTTPMAVDLAPGESRVVRQPAGLGALPSGASGWMQLYIGAADAPAYGEALYRLGNYTIWQDAGGRKMISMVPFPF